MLEVRGLTKRYGDLVALDGATFSVAPGRIVGFLGPNGAGKTTTMRAVFGLLTPDHGEVRWRGEIVGQKQRARFGYMPEERGLYPKMRVGEQLDYFARLSGLGGTSAKEAVARWLDRLSLTDRGDARLEELSHGNQQRIQLAAALVHDPELAVLDEPFSGLDPLGIEALSGLLEKTAAEGVAVLFSSHQLDLVEDVCQDVVVIDHGRVVLQGELDRLRAASSRRYLEVDFRGIDRWVPAGAHARVLLAEPGHTRLELADGFDLEALARLARSAGEVTRFSLQPPALSDLFREALQP